MRAPERALHEAREAVLDAGFRALGITDLPTTETQARVDARRLSALLRPFDGRRAPFTEVH